MLDKIKTGLKHAFAVETPGYRFEDEDTRIVDKMADFLVKRSLTAPAIFLVKSSTPLNMLANQLLVFLNPFATFVFNEEEYKRFAGLLEHRCSLEFIVSRIEESERRFRANQDKDKQPIAEKQVGQGT